MKFRAWHGAADDTLGSNVPRFLVFFLLLVLAWSLGTGVLAQERHNFVAVDGAIVDDAGPYYFIAHGDSSNAFVRAQPLATALGLDLAFDPGSKSLVFEGAGRRATLKTTADIQHGLVKRNDVFAIDGRAFDRAVPMGILVDNVSYVAVTPVVEAFFGVDAIGWHQEARVITIELPSERPSAGGSRSELAAPRVGAHDAFTRVAIDLPAGLDRIVSVDGTNVVVTVPNARFTSFDAVVGDAHVRRVYTRSEAAADGGTSATLVIEAAGPVADDGRGFRTASTETGVFYVDVGPGLRATNVVPGEPRAQQPPAVAENPNSVSESLAAVPAEPGRRVVVIDAGHGGHDSGAVASWAREDIVVLSIALELRNLLEAEGVDVILTRDNGSFLSLQERSQFATTERNVFVSIHANAAANRSAHGVETWVFGQPLDTSLIDQAIRENGGGAQGEALTQEAAQQVANIAGEIHRQNQLAYSLNLAETVQASLVSATGARDRGVRQNLFYVIRTARIPAILVEVGFISNPEEGPKLATERYQRTIARALAEGIVDFLESGGTIASR